MAPDDATPEQILADAIEARGMPRAAVIRDGRRLRSERGRITVIEATIDLLNEGLPSTFASIAERAGVSERTVFRYIPDRDSLFAAVAVALFDRTFHLFAARCPTGTLDHRLHELVVNRVTLIGIGGKVAAEVESLTSTSLLASNLVILRNERLLNQSDTWLAPEIQEAGPFASPFIDAVLSHRAVRRLLSSYPEDEAIEILEQGIRRVLSS